jgi:hypothetical protein
MPRCPLCSTDFIWKAVVGGGYLDCPNYPECMNPLFNPVRKDLKRSRAEHTPPNSDADSSLLPSQQERMGVEPALERSCNSIDRGRWHLLRCFAVFCSVAQWQRQVNGM